MKFGIMGFGRFGKLWADALLPFGDVCICEKSFYPQTTDSRYTLVDIPTVATADVVFLLVPISELELCCQQIAPFLAPDTLVVDGCSVKIYPVQIMERHLPPNQPLLATHPLFGPDSVQRSGGLMGHKIVSCPVRCTAEQQSRLEHLFHQMGLTVFNATADEHDRQMAQSQALVHFIGRGLAALDLASQPMATPDFQALLNINKMVVNDSWRLFLDMQLYNPYAKQVRTKFLHQLSQIEKVLDNA